MKSESAVTTRENQPLLVDWLGQVDYPESLRLQADAVEACGQPAGRDRLILLEHPPVITLGRGSHKENVLASPDELARRRVEIHEVARGGDVTYHAPGQLVGYLIVDLDRRSERDVHVFLRRVESGLIRALAELDLEAVRVPGKTGVFMKRAVAGPSLDYKIASIGVGVRRWITFHGFALNVTLDLSGFDLIVPCGLDGVQMTSVSRELNSFQEGLGSRARGAVERAMVSEFA